MRPLFSFLLPLLLASVAHGTIDLTPTASDHEEHGMKYSLLTMKHGDRRIEYVPPASWSVRGAPDRLQLSPGGSRFAEALVLAVPLQAPVAFDEACLLALAQQVLRELPGGSQAPQIIERVPNPVSLGHHPSFGFLVAYQALGQTFHRRVIVVLAPDVQLTFRFTAEKSEFDKLYPVFRQSLTSWHWTQPDASK